MRCRWCGYPITAKQSALAVIGLAPMAHLDPVDCLRLSEPEDPVPAEDRDYVQQPPSDATLCPYCEGKQEVVVRLDAGTGVPVTITCPTCRGTGEVHP